VRKNSKLKDYCGELQGEIENIWGQANQRISALTTKLRGRSIFGKKSLSHTNPIPDMERDENALRRKCEDLRLTLESRTRELSQSQELYSKLKQRVLSSQTQEVPPSVSRSRTPIQAPPTGDAGHGQTKSQLPRPVLSMGARAGTSNYFPASPRHSKTQPISGALMEWNRPVFSQRTVCLGFTSTRLS